MLAPEILTSLRRYRGEALRWLTLKPAAATPGLQASFARSLRVRRAFVRAGALDKVLEVLEHCVHKLEVDEWPLAGLCAATGDRLPFAAFQLEVGGVGGIFF
jgi:hypothetical protein